MISWKKDRLARLRRDKADAEAKLSAARASWVRAVSEGNYPQEEALTVLINEAKDVIQAADYDIRALELHPDSVQ